jgi:hypothetical protein
MTAALRSNVSSQRFPPRQAGSYAGGSNVTQLRPFSDRRLGQSRLQPAFSQAINRQAVSRQAVSRLSHQTVQLPTSPATPLWLRVLTTAQRTSTVVTFSLVASALAVYGWTVYSQQLWGTEYQRLESLQRQERQLTAANEVLKDQLAKEAEDPASGLSMPNPTSAIFLQPAPLTQSPAAPQAAPASKPFRTVPLGY